MAEISKITLPNGDTYDFKDPVARVTIPFGKVDSTSTSTAFTATVPGITELADGVCMFLMNGTVTSASGYTININELGAKPVYSTMSAATRTTTIFNVNYTLFFVYNSIRVTGGCWDAYYGYYSDSNSIGYQLRTNSLTLPVSGATYRYRLLFMSPDGTKFVPANTSTSTNATAVRSVNQEKIDPFGGIRYYGTTTALSSGSEPSATVLWQQYNITLGYSFNNTGAALVLTNKKPVYIKCTPQTDGSVIIDPTTPYVQVLPSVQDGKVYIFLGVATGETTVEMLYFHPIYEYKNGQVRQWTNAIVDAATVNGHTVAANVPSNAVFTDTKNTAGSTDSSKKLFLIGAETQAANPQTYSQDTAYVGTDGKLYSNSKVVLTGGSNAASTVTITPSTTDVYSMTSAGSVTAGTANVPTTIDTTKFSGGSFTRGTFSQGTLPTLTFAMDTTDTKKLKITFGQGTLPTHAADSFTAAALQSGFYTAGTANIPTAVTLPGRSSTAIKAWTGYTAATAAAQTFTGSSS